MKKRSDFSVYFCFALLITRSLGQLSFTAPYVSNTGEYTVTSKSNGNILTLSTSRGFSWLIADTMNTNDVIYVTLLCVSTGSNADMGWGTYVSGGYPSSYQQNTVLMPVVGNNFPSLAADTRAFYYPAEPPRGQSIVSIIPLTPVSPSGATYVFKKASTAPQYTLYTSGTPNYAAATVTTFNTISFEVLNAGTASWCLQTQAQVTANKGVCDPGVTSTCATKTATTVTSQTNCDSASTMKIYNYACVTACPSGTLEVTISSSLSACQACSSPCASCSSSITSCTSCIANYYLDGTSCVTSCPSGKVADSTTMTCKSCSSPCSTCTTTQTTCTACVTTSTYYLNGNTCVTSCPSGTLANTGTKSCVSCTSPCSACSGSVTTCSSCISNYYLNGNTCVSSCPTGKVADTTTNSCVSCTSPCSSCSGSKTSCTACISNYYLNGNTCVSSCPPGTVTDSSTMTCNACVSPCSTCSGSQTSCTNCITTSTYYLDGNTCVSSCPSGTVADSSTMACNACVSPCSTCSGSQTSCTTCITTSTYYLDVISCVTSCPSGKVADSSSNSCLSCLSPCQDCTGTTTTCSNCIANYYLDGSSCVSSCPSGKMPDPNTMSCLSCLSPCQDCAGTTSTCSNCIANYYLDGTSCVSSCPSDKYADSSSQTCISCQGSCATCSGSANSCTSCQANSYLYQDTCVTACPSGYTSDSSTWKCKKNITSSSSGISIWQLCLAIFLPIFCIGTSFCLYKFIVAQRRRVYPVKDKDKEKGKESPKRFSKFYPGGHSWRVSPVGHSPKGFAKLPTFSPANLTPRGSDLEDSITPQKIAEIQSINSSTHKFKFPQFEDSSRKYEDSVNTLKTRRRFSPPDDTTRIEFSSILAPNEKLRVSANDETAVDHPNMTASNLTMFNTKEIIKQTFNL